MKSYNSIKILLFFLIPVFSFAQEKNCELIGFWKGEENGQVIYQDFNDRQILVIDNSAKNCHILDKYDYNITQDTVLITVRSSGGSERVIKTFAQFINCDSLHLYNVSSGDGSLTSFTALTRVSGHECDQANSFYKKNPFFKRKKVIQAGSILFLIIYLPVLIFWIYCFFKKQPRDKYWWMLILICLVFSFIIPACFLLFTLHLSLSVAKRIRANILHPYGQVITYGAYAGVVVLLEYFIRYGANEQNIQIYFTFIPLLVTIIGLRFIYHFIIDDIVRAYFSFGTSILVGFALFFIPYIFIVESRASIFNFFSKLLPFL